MTFPFVPSSALLSLLNNMSGHSKWQTIKRRKDAVDKKRSSLFTKLVKNIIVAAKDGPDPEMNFKLRLAIDKAKVANMPKDNIERAIAKGSGIAEGQNFEEIIYEVFGPGGVAILVLTTTDNRNRTAADVKAIVNKFNANLGAPNSVQWQFEKKGVFRILSSHDFNKEGLELKLIDLGVDDIKDEEGGVTVEVAFTSFEKIKKSLESENIKLDYAQVDWLAKEKISVDDDIKEKNLKLIEKLDEHDDVDEVYLNLK